MARLNPDNNFVPMKRGPSGRLIIGEAPGETEAAQGEPFTGGAGKWLDGILRSAGIKRDDVNIINVIQCRPPENVFPTDGEARSYILPEQGVQAVRHCYKNHVLPVLRERAWERVDLLGNKALAVVGGRTEGVYKWRGSPIPIPDLGDKPIAIATLHPAAIMREQTMLPVMVNDLCKSTTVPPENYTLFPTLEQVQAFTAKEFAFDIEVGKDWSGAWSRKPTMVGLSDGLYRAIVVPFQGAYIAELKKIFKQSTSVVGHNCIQFDLPVLQENGVALGDNTQVWDTMLLQHLRFPDLPHDLEFVGSQFSNKPAWKHDKGTMELYNARDVDVTFQAFKQLKPLCAQAGLLELYENIQVPLAKICVLMHDTGIKIDPNRIGSVREKLQLEMVELEKLLPEQLRSRMVAVKKRKPAPPGTVSAKTGKPVKFIHEQAEELEVPWRSSDVVEQYLYETLALPQQTDVKTQRVTTGKMALEKLYRKTKNPALDALRKLRKINSLLTLFCKEQLLKVDRQHTHFNVHGTSGGRLSSSDPNLQNITQAARYIYVPSHPGWKLIDVDYSQIENRLTAYFADDTERMDRFIRDPKFSEHKYLAALITGMPYDEVVKDNDKDAPYGKAKRVVHGGNYGLGAKKMSLMYDMDFKETKEIMERWKAEIAKTVAWQNRCTEKAKSQGYLATPFARRRWFYTTSYYTESLSFLPQSTAADVLFRAMVALMYERIAWPLEKVQKVVRHVEALPKPARLLLSVHDSLVLEAPPELIPQVVGVLKRVMEQPWPELGGLSIPIGIKVGDSWAECHDYEGPIV